MSILVVQVRDDTCDMTYSLLFNYMSREIEVNSHAMRTCLSDLRDHIDFQNVTIEDMSCVAPPSPFIRTRVICFRIHA